MAGFKNLEDLVGDLGEGLRKLRAGALEPEELTPLVQDARELCDRLTLLRFKAHEFSYEIRRKAPQGGLDNTLADRQPVRPFRIGAAYQTSLIDAIEEVSREQAERAEEERRDAGTPGLFDAVPDEMEAVRQVQDAAAPDVEIEDTSEPLEVSTEGKGESDEAVETPALEGEEKAVVEEVQFHQDAQHESPEDDTIGEDQVEPETDLEPAPEPSPAPAFDAMADPEPQPEQEPIADAPMETSSEPTSEPEEVQQETPTLAERMERMPIEDLRKAFSLVEKYECIKMLFDDDAGEFNRVLDALEEAGTFELALHWLKQQVPAFAQWDSEDPTVMRFLDRVERRYL